MAARTTSDVGTGSDEVTMFGSGHHGARLAPMQAPVERPMGRPLENGTGGEVGERFAARGPSDRGGLYPPEGDGGDGPMARPPERTVGGGDIAGDSSLTRY